VHVACIVSLEELLVNTPNKEPYDDHLKQITDFYGGDFDKRMLEAQLDVMAHPRGHTFLPNERETLST